MGARHGVGKVVCEAVRAVNRTIKHLAFFLAIVVFGGGALAATLAFAIPATRALTFGTTSNGAITPVLQALEQRSVILDRDGNTMATLYATEDRAPVTLKDVSPGVIAAVVSIEDRTFFSHRGVDPKSILRALFKDVHSGVVSQGGSTITQQLVKNTLIENPKRDLQRKVREAVLAMRLEKIYTKDEILERYLNTVYFGRDAYGIRAASERYFNEQPIKLTIPQAAMLAGMIAAPSGYDPVLHPAAAHHRRYEVLLAMRETGVIGDTAVRAFNRYPLPTRAFNSVATIAPTSYFVATVVQRLLADPRLGPDLPTRRNLIYHGGLRITTTYDRVLQREAEDAVKTEIANAANQPNIPVTGALVSIDNSNGAVRAMVSGSGDASGAGFLKQQFNYATGANRQVGSSFKVFTLATALENGYSPNDTIDGSAGCTIPPGLTTDNKPYSPGGEGGGVMTLRTAITNSINCAFVRLIVALGGDPNQLNAAGYTRAAAGPQKVIDVAHEMGVTAPLQPVTSLTLGTEGISPLDMASAYSTLANDGVHRPPMFVTKVQGPDGKIVFQEPLSGHGKQVMPVNIARTETDMLQGPVRSGTASRTLGNFPRPAAGKTGTTDRNVDAWFVGFTPQLTTAVWMGDPAGDTISMNPFFNGGQVFGGTIPARIWRNYMELALANLPPLNFTPPDQGFWPFSRYISMTGRGTGSPPTTTTTVPPTTTTVKPKPKPKPKTTTTTSPKTTTTTAPHPPPTT